jgi:sugar O-acyltransferase (sialic acid O-acetyltransferase NeuD family)
MENPVLIFGAKNLGKIALDIFKSNEVVVYGFLEDDEKLHKTEIKELSIFGNTEDENYLKLIGKQCEAFVAIEDSKERKFTVKMLIESYKTMPVNAIHKQAFIESSAILGHGNMIGAFAKILTDAQIGNHCIIQAGTIIDCGAKVGDFVEIGTGCLIAADVEIGEGAFIGAGAIIIAGLKIGKNAKIGAGSVVIKPVRDGDTVFGMPAQNIQAHHLIK